MAPRWFTPFLALTGLLAASAAMAQELVHFPSLDAERTVLDGYLFHPASTGRHPAVVFLHGCSGMFTRTGTISPIYFAWAYRFQQLGYTVLAVDSLGPRHHGEMCSIGGFDSNVYRDRPKDAYGALAWLQTQGDIRGDRIAAIGWSQGGGTVLLSIGNHSLGRPADLTAPDFRAAVAFYPGGCNSSRQAADWTTSIPLLVLQGEADVWTPAAPCRDFLGAAAARGAKVSAQFYPAAYHGFDAPNVSQRELPAYVTRAGVVPIVGTEPGARADALSRVPDFLARYTAD